MIADIDRSILNELKKFERMGSISIKHYSYDDVNFMDKEIADAISGRVKLHYESIKDKGGLIEHAKVTSKFPLITVPLLTRLIKTGRLPNPKPVVVPTVKELGSKYRTLMPFLLNSIAPEKVSLIGFSNEGAASMWFSVTQEDDLGFNCIGYKGEERRIPFSQIYELGFSRIEGDQSSLMKTCRKELGDEGTKDAIKSVGFFLTKNTLKGMNRLESVEKLTRFMDSLPDMGMTIKPKEPSMAPKV